MTNFKFTAKPKNREHLAKWRSPLLIGVICLFVFESLSGFLLFFYGRFVGNEDQLAKIHWILGFGMVLPYAIYQWRHYFAVKQHSSQFHYQLGLLTFFMVCIVLVSGVPLIFDINRDGLFFTIVDLVHTVSSFAFWILFSGHLVLVARIAIRRISNREPAEIGVFSLIGRTVLWLPLAVSILALLVISFWG